MGIIGPIDIRNGYTAYTIRKQITNRIKMLAFMTIFIFLSFSYAFQYISYLILINEILI